MDITDNQYSQFHPDVVEAALDDTLQELGLDYLDVCLITSQILAKHTNESI